ncbi:MAG: hypothetical protein AAGA17_15680, partial [Actinomycetota bacterium]
MPTRRSVRRRGLACGLLTLALVAGPTIATSGADEHETRILFVRGADRSGGFLEAGDDAQRTEQLADITNTSTARGNHGWGALAAMLRGAGHEVTQIAESAEGPGPTDGLAVDLVSLDLDGYDVVVLGSNNAAYGSAAVDALDAYVRRGGAALFISDANFGGSWQDAPNSDQAFLDRYGIVVHQDTGTYRIDDDELAAPTHPVVDGVEAVDGEGVSPFDVGAATVDVTIVAPAEGQVRLNPGDRQGPTRATGDDDAAVWVAEAGDGRLAGHFDRNTFFNDNGAGTHLGRLDNARYATNLFAWLAGGERAPVPTVPGPTVPGPVPPEGPMPPEVPTVPGGVGYWMGDAGGQLYGFGDATTPNAVPGSIVDSSTTPDGTGLWVLTTDGTVHALAGATDHGSLDPTTLDPGETPSTISVLPDGTGYWIFTNR